MIVNDSTKFVILSTQRSGSTWLVDTLNQMDKVSVYGELFLRERRVWDAGELDFPRFIESTHPGSSIRPLSVFAYLGELFARPNAVGFKLMYAQLRTYPEILIYLLRHRIRIIHLVRKNHLDVLISKRIVRTHGQAHLLAGQRQPDSIHIHLDPQILVAQMNKLQRNVDLIRYLLSALRMPHLEVAYEELLNNESCFISIWRFLALDTTIAVPSSSLRKIARASHADLISNYQEVKQVLAATKYRDLIR